MNENKKIKISGAHFATEDELKNEKFLQNEGCIYGEFNNELVADSSYINMLLLTPTGTGKGVSFVIPNLLSWNESVIIHDIKLENYKLTSGYRQNELKQKIFVWNPVAKDGITNCYNPLDWISKDSKIVVNDIQNIIRPLLYKNDYLQIEARSLLTSIILYLLAENKTVTFGKILKIVKNTRFLNDLRDALDNIELHPVARANINSFLKKSENEKNDIIFSILKALYLWSDPLIDYATSKSDFSISDFINEKQTLYIGVEINEMERLKPLFKMFYQQCFNIIVSSNTEYQKIKYGILMILDEFTTIGRIDPIVNAIPYTRGYKLKVCIIEQNIDRLNCIYEGKEVNQILSNTNKIIFAPNNRNTANLLSEMIGDEIIIDENGNKTPRPLMLSQEIVDLKKKEEIILMVDSKIIKCNKFFYYERPEFSKRIMNKAEINIK